MRLRHRLKVRLYQRHWGQVLRIEGHRWLHWGCNSTWACQDNEMRSCLQNHNKMSPALCCKWSYEIKITCMLAARTFKPDYTSLKHIFSSLPRSRCSQQEGSPSGSDKKLLSWCILLHFLMALPVQAASGCSNSVLWHMWLKGRFHFLWSDEWWRLFRTGSRAFLPVWKGQSGYDGNRTGFIKADTAC